MSAKALYLSILIELSKATTKLYFLLFSCENTTQKELNRIKTNSFLIFLYFSKYSFFSILFYNFNFSYNFIGIFINYRYVINSGFCFDRHIMKIFSLT